MITLASETLSRSEVEACGRLLRHARIDVRVGQNEKRVLWHKLARIAPLAAATAASGRRSASSATTRVAAAARSSRRRGCAVAEADGVSLRASAQWAIIDAMADETTTSAARDVAAGRRSELDAIVGSVLRAADAARRARARR